MKTLGTRDRQTFKYPYVTAFGTALLTLLGACFVTNAQSLRFTGGYLINTNVVMDLSGPSNLVVQVERLNPVSDLWETNGVLVLNSSGSGTHYSSLLLNAYGVFRARSTNSSHFSTNGFGAVVGVLQPGNNFVGNLFGLQSITNIVPNPPDGLQVYRWNPVTNSYSTYSYSFSTWYPSAPEVDYCEGIIVRNNTATNLTYQVTGILTTNTVQKSLYGTLNLIGSQLYRITETNSWRVDTLDTNRLGGLSSIPVQSSGFNPQAKLFQAISTVPDYDEFQLTSSNKWELFGIQTNIHLQITEGFWIQKPTNAVWSIQRSLW